MVWLKPICLFTLLLSGFHPLWSSTPGEAFSFEVIPFGEAGYFKMIYDRRQGPNALRQGDTIFIATNERTQPNAKGNPAAQPVIRAYDLKTGAFQPPVLLGPASTDHHDGPVLWANPNGTLNVLAGCHRTPGLHWRSVLPGDIGTSLKDWTCGLGFLFKISYPKFFQLPGDRQLIYFRTGGHTSSWTYAITSDSGLNWERPEHAVTDLDRAGRLDWSAYHAVQLSPDGRTLHVAFCDYDDNKAKDPKRFFNPRYEDNVYKLERKYNLHTLAIDLKTHQVRSGAGEVLTTPVHIDQARETTMIWDTEWRYTGIPPEVAVGRDASPAFLFTLSGEAVEDIDYYFIRKGKTGWDRVKIRSAGHPWNCGTLRQDADGTWHALLVVSDGPLETERLMEKHGGGRIEEWVSHDEGESWVLLRDLTPDPEKYAGWRFNNVRPVNHAEGGEAEGMFVCYGWKDPEVPDATGFLFIDAGVAR